MWREFLVGLDWVRLHASPVYFGYGAPRGDGSPVITVPGFLGSDLYLSELRWWFHRMGYSSFPSGIGANADCPNKLQLALFESIERAVEAVGRPVHLVGHSLGGLIARSAAVQRPDLVRSVITLGSPFRGFRVHPWLLRMRETVRRTVIARTAPGMLPERCYSFHCECACLESLAVRLPEQVREFAIYTQADGVVDWDRCRTGDPARDREVGGTHSGLVFNARAYEAMAEFLATVCKARRRPAA